MAIYDALILAVEEGEAKNGTAYFKFKLENCANGNTLEATWFDTTNPQGLSKGEFVQADIVKKGEYFNIKDITRDPDKKPLTLDDVNAKALSELQNDPKQQIITRTSALNAAINTLVDVDRQGIKDILELADVYYGYILGVKNV
jgi:hypothetical protein